MVSGVPRSLPAANVHPIPKTIRRTPNPDCSLNPVLHHNCESQSRRQTTPVSPWMVCLLTLAAQATCQLDVLGLDGDTFGVDGAQVGVLDQRDEV